MNKTEKHFPPPPESSVKLCLVCSRSVTGDPAFFPRAEHKGRTIYFCTEFCLSAFQSDPERFYAAHSRDHGKD